MKLFWGNILVVILVVLVSSPLYAWDTVNGIAISTLSTDISPVLASDSAGGAIIVWNDQRNGESNSDIYAQRISAAGTTLWVTNGVAICTAANDQQFPAIISDDSGGAIITWEDYRSGSDYHIYAQHVNSQGSTLWTNNGIAICNASNNQEYPQLVGDGSGGAIIVWSDFRGGSTGDIYAQRVNSAGSTLWTNNGIAICAATNDQEFPLVVSDDSGGAIIIWQDKRNGSKYNIYSQRVNSNGTTLWTSNGVEICASADESLEEETLYAITKDGSSGAIISWQDYRSNGTTGHVYAQRVNSSGSVLWTANGVGICTAVSFQDEIQILGDGAGDAIIAWSDARNGSSNTDIYAQRVNSQGSTLWSLNGVVICAAIQEQQYPMIASDGSGGAIISWTDFRNDLSNTYFPNIYAQRVNSQGSTLWTSDGITICDAYNVYIDTQEGQFAPYPPATISDGNGGAIMTWYDGRNTDTISGYTYNIYAQSVYSDGNIAPVSVNDWFNYASPLSHF